MKELNIANIILNCRKEKGVTQSDLANFIGVSKTSVSKWETGQSYPDITLLPQLASYFEISVDDLIGYEPQMPPDQIQKLYQELSLEFATKPFEVVIERCRGHIKKYYSCYPLLFQMGVLLINYSLTIAKDEEQKISTLNEARELLVRVKRKSNEIDLKQVALYTEANCLLMLNQPEDVVHLLESEHTKDPSHNLYLSQAYQMLEKGKLAKVKLQESIYEHLTMLLSTLSLYLRTNRDDIDAFEEVYHRAERIIDLFNLKELIPFDTLAFYIVASQGYCYQVNKSKALESLESYVDIATSDIFPSGFRGDDFLDLIHHSEMVKELPSWALFQPRDESSIRLSIVDVVANNPELSILIHEPRFKVIVRKLNAVAKKKA